MRAYGNEVYMESLITKKKMNLGEAKDVENAIAERDMLRSLVEYNIMMGNIEDPSEEEEEE